MRRPLMAFRPGLLTTLRHCRKLSQSVAEDARWLRHRFRAFLRQLSRRSLLVRREAPRRPQRSRVPRGPARPARLCGRVGMDQQRRYHRGQHPRRVRRRARPRARRPLPAGRRRVLRQLRGRATRVVDELRVLLRLRARPRFEAEHFDPKGWSPLWSSPAFSRATARDLYWGIKRVLAFSPDELRAAIRVGRYRPEVEQRLFEVLWQRREKLARAYLPGVARRVPRGHAARAAGRRQALRPEAARPLGAARGDASGRRARPLSGQARSVSTKQVGAPSRSVSSPPSARAISRASDSPRPKPRPLARAASPR